MSKRAAERPKTGTDNRRTSFDAVKLELAVVLVIALAASIVVAALEAPSWLELLVLAAVGFAGGGWVAVRVRRVAAADRSGKGRG